MRTPQRRAAFILYSIQDTKKAKRIIKAKEKKMASDEELERDVQRQRLALAVLEMLLMLKRC